MIAGPDACRGVPVVPEHQRRLFVRVPYGPGAYRQVVSECPATITLPRGEWELLLELVEFHARQQEQQSDLWRSWSDDITSAMRSQLGPEQPTPVLSR